MHMCGLEPNWKRTAAPVPVGIRNVTERDHELNYLQKRSPITVSLLDETFIVAQNSDHQYLQILNPTISICWDK